MRRPINRRSSSKVKSTWIRWEHRKKKKEKKNTEKKISKRQTLVFIYSAMTENRLRQESNFCIMLDFKFDSRLHTSIKLFVRSLFFSMNFYSYFFRLFSSVRRWWIALYFFVSFAHFSCVVWFLFVGCRNKSVNIVGRLRSLSRILVIVITLNIDFYYFVSH